MARQTPYEVLGVDRSAVPDEIKRAFRRKAKAVHPDVAGRGGKAAFQQLNAAYALLMDRERRADYDATGNEEGVLEQKHVALLLQAFHFALFQFIGGAITDIPGAIRKDLRAKLQDAQARSRQGKDDAARLAKLRGRITRTGGGENWMEQQVDEAAELVDRTRQQIGVEIGDLQKALELLPEFQFPQDGPPPGWNLMPAQPFRDAGFNFPHGDSVQFFGQP